MSLSGVEVKGVWIDREDVICVSSSVVLGSTNAGVGVEGEGEEGGSVMSSSGDFVSLGKAGVGVGEMGRDRDREDEGVGENDVATIVSVAIPVVLSGSSVSMGSVGVGVGEKGNGKDKEGEIVSKSDTGL